MKDSFVCKAALLLHLTVCLTSCDLSAPHQENALAGSSPAVSNSQPPLRTLPGNLPAVRFVSEPAGPPDLYSRGSYIDDENAWVAAEFQVKRTTDGGRTWQLMRPSTEDEAIFGKLGGIYVFPAFITRARGWLTAREGLWQTEDGGLTWQQIFKKQTGSPHFADEQHGWLAVYGEDDQQSYVTKDGGQSWKPCGPKQRRDQQTPETPFFLTAQTGWAITSHVDEERRAFYGVARTTDGGCTWRQLWTEEQDQQYCQVYFLNEKEGWLAGCYGTPRLVQTKDGGKNWIEVKTPVEAWRSAPVDVYFVDSNKGWIITRATESGNQEGLYRTTDGGQTWRQLTIDDLMKGVGANGGENEIPRAWRAGRLFQMLYVNRMGR